MIYPLEVFFRRLRRHFSRSEWVLRRSRLSKSEETSSEPGLLLIQIDGLAQQQMERAMAHGRLPFLRSLIQKQHYEVATFYSGLPSTTAAVQGELFYEVRCAVPSFSFLSRPEKRVAAMFNPNWVKRIEANLEKQGEGLLNGGSSWSNTYRGGAAPEESHFCAASIGPGEFFRSISLFGLLSIMLLQFPAILRLVGLLFAELFIALWDVAHGVYRGESVFMELKFVISRVFVCLGLREVITIGAGVDLARGLPIVHVNFVGYDEQSHRRGPNSAFAHWSLKGIDFAIRKLYRNAQRSQRREYQVWIFSDHGQERTRSFHEEFPPGIEHTIHEGLKQMGRSQGQVSKPGRRPGSRAVWVGGRRAEKHLAKESLNESLTAEEERLFSVTALGPVGHVYLANGMSVDEKHILAKWLVSEGHVPGVLFPVGAGEANWVHSRGISRLPKDGEELLSHPPARRRAIAHDLLRLCHHEFAGDLVLLGWSPDAEPWTFAFERGAHGGPGLSETAGFTLLPAKTRLPETVEEFVRPMDLRRAVLHRLGRQVIPRRKRVSELVPSYHLRIMTYNVHSCLGMDGRISPHRIARVIELFDADIVALQEIDLGRARSRWHDQAKIIAAELHMEVSFCPTIVRGSELYGHALLSRFPLTVLRTGALEGGPRSPKCEPRGALLARVELGTTAFYVLNTHFGLRRLERAAQVSDLLGEKWLGAVAAREPLIVCGDFNMIPGSLPYRALAARLHDVQLRVNKLRPMNTFAALFPFSRIDHIFVSHHFEVEKVQVPQNNLTRVASDHLPLLADLRLTKEEHPPAQPVPGTLLAQASAPGSLGDVSSLEEERSETPRKLAAGTAALR
ncbi:MAG: endonuclease/exonuclease/phosphatase family protein [Verrucomicrobiales bacterium]|nr:endonuclease/exonuclease/phosphatase family protein [Verrucomicrobiales bacterium]